MSNEFHGQIAVVVGAASGIGFATASRFRESGATVAWLDVEPDVAEVAAKVEAAHGGTGAYTTDIVDATNLEQMQQAAGSLTERYGRIDHLVVSIGMCSGSLGFPFWNVAPAAWQQVLDVNLVGPVNAVHAFVNPLLQSSQGSICLVASVAGQIGSQTDPPYSAAKAGLINFAQCAAKDLATHGVRVNAVSPGMVKTPMNRQVWQAWRDQSPANNLSYDAWADQKIKQVAPLGRWQTCDDVAHAILFLASGHAANITGQTVNVDGGQVMHA